MAATLESYLGSLRDLVDTALERVLAAGNAPAALAAPMRHALLGPGKRLRPCVTLAAAESVASLQGRDGTTARLLALPAACAVEMIHAYSLAHDDLPAMDDDALRRGRPTTHVVYGEGPAILAGDALLTDAFGVLATAPSPAVPPAAPEAPVSHRLRALSVLAAAAGSAGMVGGQAIDLAAAGRALAGGATLDAAALHDMHARKTGALIRAAATMGAILADAADDLVQAVDDYARDLGLTFQIVDDVLDVEGTDAALGKTSGKDAAAGKPTFPALYGLAASRRLAAEGTARAIASLARVGLSGRLAEIAQWSLERHH